MGFYSLNEPFMNKKWSYITFNSLIIGWSIVWAVALIAKHPNGASFLLGFLSGSLPKTTTIIYWAPLYAFNLGYWLWNHSLDNLGWRIPIQSYTETFLTFKRKQFKNHKRQNCYQLHPLWRKIKSSTLREAYLRCLSPL